MPGSVAETTAKSASKRKRPENGDQSKKRRKSGGGGDDAEAQIAKLESEILESKKHYNNLATLINLSEKLDENITTALVAAEALCRSFIRLLAQGNLVKKRDASEKDATVTTWLRERLGEYQAALCSMLHREESAIGALILAMALLKAEAQHLDDRDEWTFPRSFFSSIVAAVVQSPVDHLRDEFMKKFVDQYDDIRYYTLQGIKYGTPSMAVGHGLTCLGNSWMTRTKLRTT